jgi:hypothetical protein
VITLLQSRSIAGKFRVTRQIDIGGKESSHVSGIWFRKFFDPNDLGK